MSKQEWYVYILECDNGSLYTGITKNIYKRTLKHMSGEGAKYTRSFPPVKLQHIEGTYSRSKASKKENEIKTWDKDKKYSYISGKNQ